MAYALWQRHLKFAPQHPDWWDRDRFVLSAGHGSMLLYSLLHLYGYALPMEELRAFRQWGSKTPGHPEFGLTPGVEATTGPLGQGAANAVGMALAERYLAATYNRPDLELFNHHTFALVSDGDLMEGVSAEAASFAGQQKLSKLIYLYDANDVTLDGPASLSFSSEDVAKRFEAYGWRAVTVKDGDQDLNAIESAILEAKAQSEKPTLIVVKTTIGFGSPNKQGKSASHGSPLGREEVELTKRNLGWAHAEAFTVPGEAKARFAAASARSEPAFAAWRALWDQYRQKYPAEAKELEQAFARELPADWAKDVPKFAAGDDQATRQASGKVLNALAKRWPTLIGGDADLSVSTNTAMKDLGAMDARTPGGRNIHYGVREHAMASVANGIAYHGGLRSFTATFLCFSDYMRPALRLAAMNHLPVVHVWTHDSIGLGEDGPTHQPVEHVASLRAIPGFHVFRPCDANETAEAWKAALSRKDGPTGLVLSRQKLPTLDRAKYAPSENAARGAYVISESKGTADGILIATGSEVKLALKAQELLAAKGKPVRVVSMPCWELFERQDPAYRESVLPKTLGRRVSIEAGSPFGWAKWVGSEGKSIGVDRYGASAPDSVLFEQYGFTAEKIAETYLSL